jgi:hypothetical protein
MMVWSEDSVSECPSCGATIAVGIMSLCATCPYDGFYYVDVNEYRGWYSSKAAYENGMPEYRVRPERL